MSSNININAEKQRLEALRSQHSGDHPDIAHCLYNLGV